MPLRILLFLAAVMLIPQFLHAENDSTLVVTGVVKDKKNRKVVPNASVVLKGTQIATVTNVEGVFTLKMPARAGHGTIEISHIGYASSHVQKLRNAEPLTILLTPNAMLLDEVVVFGGSAKEIVAQALAKIPVNYPERNNLLSVFYRETVQKGRRYTSISEGFVNMLKTSYHKRNIDFDRVQIHKGRQLMSQKLSDTLAVKFMGGPLLGLQIDMVKNPDILFDYAELEYYNFTMDTPVFLDNRRQFVISFRPIIRKEYPLYVGQLFIDSETLAFTRAEFQMQLENRDDRDKVSSFILRKKPFGMRFAPLEVNFVVSYRQNGDRFVLNYIKNDLRFKCDWKRRLFSSRFSVCTEMVVVDNDENTKENISRKEAFSSSQVFSDVVDIYWNEDFWREYNIIEPTESLEKAVRNLRK